MEFQIILQDPLTKVYAPGDRVQGAVVLNARSDVAASSITVHFHGKTKAQADSGQNERKSKSTLFSYRQRLYTGKFTFSAANQFEWPFAFDLPLTPQGWKGDAGSNRDGSWRYDAQSPLPPTMSCSNNSMSHDFSCSVQYVLEADLMRLETSFTGLGRKFHSQRNLSVQPKRQEENPCIQTITKDHLWRAQSLRILPEYQERKFTMKEKMHSAFSSKLPVSAFRVVTALPNQTINGSVLPISVQVEHTAEKSTTDVIPAVHLREICLSLTHLTSVRVSGEFGGWKYETTDQIRRFFLRKDIDFLLYDENTSSLPDTTPLDLGEIFNIKCYAPANFVTYNIKRSYSLTLRIVLQCADKCHTVQHMVGGFRVHSRDYDPLPIPASADNIQPPADVESAPPYQSAIQGVPAGVSHDPPPTYSP